MDALNMVYSERITVRLTQAQAAKLRALAMRTGRDRSQVLRILIDAALRDDRPDIYLDQDKAKGLGKR